MQTETPTVSMSTYADELLTRQLADLDRYGAKALMSDRPLTVIDVVCEGGGPSSWFRFWFQQNGDFERCELHSTADRGRSETISHAVSVAALDDSPGIERLAASVWRARGA